MVDRHRQAIRQPGHKVDEVAAFADDAPSAHFRIMQPVIQRQRSGVDGVLHHARLVGMVDELASSPLPAVRTGG